eukprot:4931907-Prymnesium_polylepis.1
MAELKRQSAPKAKAQKATATPHHAGSAVPARTTAAVGQSAAARIQAASQALRAGGLALQPTDPNSSKPDWHGCPPIPMPPRLPFSRDQLTHMVQATAPPRQLPSSRGSTLVAKQPSGPATAVAAAGGGRGQALHSTVQLGAKSRSIVPPTPGSGLAPAARAASSGHDQ